MGKLNLLILDILKPHKPNIMDFGNELMKSMTGVSVNLRVVEIDEKTESVQLVATGDDIDFDKMKVAIESQGASVHSIDEVSIGGQKINSNQYIRIEK